MQKSNWSVVSIKQSAEREIAAVAVTMKTACVVAAVLSLVSLCHSSSLACHNLTKPVEQGPNVSKIYIFSKKTKTKNLWWENLLGVFPMLVCWSVFLKCYLLLPSRGSDENKLQHFQLSAVWDVVLCGFVVEPLCVHHIVQFTLQRKLQIYNNPDRNCKSLWLSLRGKIVSTRLALVILYFHLYHNPHSHCVVFIMLDYSLTDMDFVQM